MGELCGNDPEVTREVMELMLNGVAAGLERLEAAVDAGDGRRVAWEDHSLKSIFLTVGAEVLAAACQELMTVGELGDAAGFATIYQSTRNQWERLEEEANHYLHTLRISGI